MCKNYMNKLKILDLCSGIGGFSLGLEATGGFETIAFCEFDKFCQKVLKKHWPDVPIYNDLKEISKDEETIINEKIQTSPPIEETSLPNHLIISIDTLFVQMAGLLNIPTWVMLNLGSDWKWIRDREDFPWHSSVKVFSQKEYNNWSYVIKKIQKELTYFFK